MAYRGRNGKVNLSEVVRQTIRKNPGRTARQIKELIEDQGYHPKKNSIHAVISSMRKAGEKVPVVSVQKPAGVGEWSRARAYLLAHPDATTDEVAAATGSRRVYIQQARGAIRKKAQRGGQMVASEALAKFKAARETLRKRGDLPGGDSALKPFRLEVSVDERGLELVINNCSRIIGTLELTPDTLTFIRGKAVKTAERPISFDGLAAMQGIFV